ncbi:MAG: cupin domain-containing protein [Planctomycetes bacterium]|nr:cupin domain-containing protein [Planctomycetota bacterium]
MQDSPGNLFADLHPDPAREVFETLVQTAALTVERITSCGQTSPSGEWLCEPRGEWVAVLQGEAKLLREGDAQEIRLGPGDHVVIPAGTRHRVTATSREPPTIWLAVHFEDCEPEKPARPL